MYTRAHTHTQGLESGSYVEYQLKYPYTFKICRRGMYTLPAARRNAANFVVGGWGYEGLYDGQQKKIVNLDEEANMQMTLSVVPSPLSPSGAFHTSVSRALLLAININLGKARYTQIASEVRGGEGSV